MKQLSFDDYDPNQKTFEHNIPDPLDCEYIEPDTDNPEKRNVRSHALHK